MPQIAAIAIPAIAGIAGSVLSAKGGSGKQGQQSSTFERSSVEDLSRLEKAFQDYFGSKTDTPTEPEYFSAFRQSLVPQFGRLLGLAGQPVFGKAQTAGFMQNLNDLTSAATENLKQTLARSGALESGRFGAGLTGINLNRVNQASQFFGNLPFMEKQAQIQNLGNVLGMGLGWAGKAPTGMTSSMSGGQTSASDITSHGTASQKGTGQETVFGPGFGSSFLNSMGGMVGGATQGYGPLSGLYKYGLSKLGIPWNG